MRSKVLTLQGAVETAKRLPLLQKAAAVEILVDGVVEVLGDLAVAQEYMMSELGRLRRDIANGQ